MDNFFIINYIMDLSLRKKKWQYYGFLGALLVAYTILFKPKTNNMKILWISYILLAALIGILE